MAASLDDYRQAIQRSRAVYREVLGRAIDDEGLANTLRRQLDDGETSDDLRAWLEGSAEYAARQAAVAAREAERVAQRTEAPLPPLAGRLRIEGDTYADDHGPRVPIALHAGDLACCYTEGRRQDVEAAFAQASRAGYQIIRTWTSLGWFQRHPYWGDRRLDPNDRETRRQLTECFRIGAEDHGLAFHVALGDADAPREAIRAYFDWLASLVHERPHWFALVEGVNEGDYTGAPDASEVASWIKISRDANPDTLHALSAAAGAAGSEEADELVEWTPADQRMFYVHANRGGHWGDQTRHAFSIAYKDPPRRLGWSGEPPGMQWPGNLRVSSMTYPHEWTERPWRYAFYLAQTAMCRQVPTYMCSHGVVLPVGGRFADAPAFDLAPRLLSDLPRDVHSYDRLFHGGTTWRAVRVIAAAEGTRVDHALRTADGACVMTAYPDGTDVTTTTLTVERPFKGRVHSSLGFSDVALARGDQWTVDLTEGLLLVGQVLE